MLFQQAVEPATFSLLRDLVRLPSLNRFYLVGGTALALQVGHRRSVDLDLFTDFDYDQEAVLSEIPGDYETIARSEIFLGLSVKGTKVDLLKYPFPRINPLVINEGIPMADIEEIGGMKLWAITRRGTKKDFVDLYVLLKQFSLLEMMEFFKRKFPKVEPLMVLRSLTYFVDAENDLDPEMLIDVDWETVRETIQKAATEFMFK